MIREVARWTYNAGLSLANPLLRPSGDPKVLLLVGSGRSGTTALMEALAAGLSAQPIFEPLRPAVTRAVDKVVPLHGYPRIPVDADAPEMEALMGALLAGKYLTRWSTAQTSLRRLREAECLLVKEVRANRMAGWIQGRFPEVDVRYIVRHPHAVVSSMMKGSWGRLPWTSVVPPAADSLGVPSNELAPESSPQSRWLTALWLADNLLAIRELGAETLARTVYYEELIRSPRSVLAPYAQEYAEFDIESALLSLQRPSQHASPEFGRSGKSKCSGITEPERRDMASMLRDFGVDFYAIDEPGLVKRIG